MVDLGGVKKPALKRVRMSADAMLKALLGSKHTPAEAAGDWRKNIEDKADRKKMVKKMSSSRRHHLKEETAEIIVAKAAYLSEHCAKPDLSGDQAALMEVIKPYEEVSKTSNRKLVNPPTGRSYYTIQQEVNIPPTGSYYTIQQEIEDLKMKVVELAGVKKPALKKVRMSADSMLQALLRKTQGDHGSESLILQIAAVWIEEETKELIAAKEAYMSENAPHPDLGGDMAALQELCKKLHQALDKIDDSRYDAEAKVKKSDLEIEDLKMKVVDLAGVKKPALKKVRMSADAMLQALLGGKHKVTMDLRSNLKQVKKEVKEESLYRSLSESSIFDLIPADFISSCFSTLPDSPSACSLQTFDPFPRQNWIYGRCALCVLSRRRSSPAGLGSPYASNTPSENLLLGEKLTPTPETRNYGSLQGSKTPQRKKMTSSRRHALKSLILTIAAKWLDEEKAADIAAKEAYMAEHCVKPSMSGDQAALMEACKKLHALLDKLDEERYDLGSKVGKADKEALLGSKHSVNMDLRANLKQVKKEVKEEPQEAAGDWRKNVEDKADRKKMFEAT
ncbi:hypothetical protein F7725_023441 [Dissostichus mawsoni]|uniref:Uncharacterized protein n=1 Tax=Dissostichus mawsoni TaxID=36200 RepID=A0A7J5Z171_DISMA|nr:hypothetical protein F7725_023441 [Dissostichus mawsoni]